MSYLSEVYFQRINHMGDTIGERIRNGGIRSFEKWLAESPHTVTNLSVERGIYFPGLILTSKDKEYEKIMFLNVSNKVDIKVGDIMTWPLEDGTIEKWILIQEEKKVNGTYRTFWIVRCNYFIKWIDELGHLQQSWSYVVSSVDSKIKGNFRTWNNLITPQPNKYAEIIIPRYNIMRSTNFIIEDESWQLVEYDYTSVPGIIYLSLTENKVNAIYDDLQADIADTDKLAQYKLAAPAEPEQFVLGTEIKPTCTLLKNGQVVELEMVFTSTDSSIAKIVDGQLKGVREGQVKLIAALKDYPNIKKELTVEIVGAEPIESIYLDGPDWIRLARSAEYHLVSTLPITEENVVFSIGETDLATLSATGNLCKITINDKNKLGKFTLTATYKNQTYEKIITVKTLW